MFQQQEARLGSLLNTAAGRGSLEAFPSGFGAASEGPAAATFGEALNIVQAREDLKRRKDGGKSKSKSKAATLLVEPATAPGGVATPQHSAFWLFVEASPDASSYNLYVHKMARRSRVNTRRVVDPVHGSWTNQAI